MHKHTQKLRTNKRVEQGCMSTYTNKALETKIKNSRLTVASKKMKHLAINLAKHVRDLCAENQEMRRKEAKETYIREIYHVYGVEDSINTMKMPILPKLNYRFNAIPTRIPGRLFRRQGCSKVYNKGINPQVA